MLDVKYIAEHPDQVKKNAANKNAGIFGIGGNILSMFNPLGGMMGK